MVTLIKGSKRKEFTERAAKILVEAYGWSEFVPLKKPVEIGHKTHPPIIEAKKLIEPIKLVNAGVIEKVIKVDTSDIDNVFEPLPEADNTEKVSEPILKNKKGETIKGSDEVPNVTPRVIKRRKSKKA